jgi:4-amino-4-deoxy-L-arabinose transferase-like glycosyltransferase
VTSKVRPIGAAPASSAATPAAGRARARTTWLALAGILTLAAFLRFWQLDGLPPGLYHDEAYYGLDALSLLNGEQFPIYHEGWELYAADAHAGRPPAPTRFPVFFEGNYGREPLHVYLVALSIWLFGPTPWAIRLVSAAAGVAAVWTTYLAAAALFVDNKERPVPVSDHRPLMAAFFIATLYPALTFSRFGIRAMLFVPFETLAVFCFWQGINKAGERGRPPVAWFAAAGFFLGAGLYTYAAARLLPLVFLVFIPLWFWLERPALARYWRVVAVMAASSVVTALPLLLFYARYPYFLVFRTTFVANKGLGTVPGKPWLTWFGNIGRVALGFFWLGEGHLRHNLPGRPYLDPIQFALFVPGFVVTLRRFLRPRDAFLLIWFGVMLLPTLLSGDAPHFGRMTGAAPAIAMLLAAGAGHLVAWLRLWLPARPVIATTLLLLAVSAIWTGRDYFAGYGRHAQLDDAFYLADWQLGQFAAAQPPEAALYLSPAQEEMATIYFALANEWQRLRSFNAAAGALPLGMPGSPAVYLVRPSEDAAFTTLGAFYAEVAPGERQADYVPFFVPGDSRRLRAEQRTAVNWGGTISLVGWSQEVAGVDLVVTLYWQAQSRLERNYTAFVHVLDGEDRVVAQLDRQPGGYPTGEWRLGEMVVDVYRVPLPSTLAPGTYTVQTGFYYLPTLERLDEPATLLPLVVEVEG